MTFINKVKSEKAKKKWTNEKLSEHSGVSVGTLNKVLSGDSADPKLSTAVSVCRALSVSLDEACGLSDFAEISPEERRFLELFRACDRRGQKAVLALLEKERELTEDEVYYDGGAKAAPAAKVLSPARLMEKQAEKRRIRLYDLPVSAGVGVFLENAGYEEITVPASVDADFTLRIRGNSMEPAYHEGDILLVKQGAEVRMGELGIFALDGDGFFKKFGGDRLISLNPDYEDILLKNYQEVSCIGAVVGRLKKKKS